MKWNWRWRMRGESKAVAEAQRKLEESDRRLRAAQPLKRSFSEMMDENHVQDLIGEWVRYQRGRGRGDAGAVPNGRH